MKLSTHFPTECLASLMLCLTSEMPSFHILTEKLIKYYFVDKYSNFFAITFSSSLGKLEDPTIIPLCVFHDCSVIKCREALKSTFLHLRKKVTNEKISSISSFSNRKRYLVNKCCCCKF